MAVTRTQFEDELVDLRNHVLEMGQYADKMLAVAMQALEERNVALATEVVDWDDTMDALDLQIETECMRLLALQQPMARDLRLIGTALKVITDIERIGDHSVDVAKAARKIVQLGFGTPLVDLPHMAQCVRGILRDALAAFVNHDLGLVDKAVTGDDEVDRLFHVIRDQLHEVMRNSPELVVHASYLLFVAHYLERMADHAVNIAERVAYVETGRLAQLAMSHKNVPEDSAHR